MVDLLLIVFCLVGIGACLWLNIRLKQGEKRYQDYKNSFRDYEKRVNK